MSASYEILHYLYFANSPASRLDLASAWSRFLEAARISRVPSQMSAAPKIKRSWASARRWARNAVICFL
jgi:hypothetical protein